MPDARRGDEGDPGSEEPLLAALAADPGLGSWSRRDALPDGFDFLAAAEEALAGHAPGGLPPLDPERALRRLVLLQIVGPYLDETVRSWTDLYERLDREDRSNVEALLGEESLAEFLGPEVTWPPS